MRTQYSNPLSLKTHTSERNAFTFVRGGREAAGRNGRDEEPLIRPDTPNQGQVLISLGEDAKLE